MEKFSQILIFFLEKIAKSYQKRPKVYQNKPKMAKKILNFDNF